MNLKKLRLHLNYSQKAMAKIVGVSEQAWCLYETGVNGVPLRRYKTLIDEFDIQDVRGFLFDEKWQPDLPVKN